MRIVVTNDDGVYAEGLWVLAEELSKIGKVLVVAPDREQSGVGTAVTLNNPVRLLPVKPLIPGIESFAVEGTPADSVILALNQVIKEGADLVVSGINQGQNLGNDILISGTVGAALQGYFSGVPSIAISVAAVEDLHLEVATALASLLAKKIASAELPRELLLNVNLPNLPQDQIEGLEITHLARRSYQDVVEEGNDGKRKYYWIVRGKSRWLEEEGTDIWALRRNRISITPLTSNLATEAHFPLLAGIRPWLMQGLHLRQQEGIASL